MTLGPYYNAKIGQVNFSAVFDAAFTLGRKYKLRLPLNFILLAKSLTTMEGLAKKYLPEFDFKEYVKPKAEELIARKLSPVYMLSSAKQSAFELGGMIKSLPGEFSRLVRAIKYGTKVNIDINNKDVKELTIELDRSSNRLALGMIIASLIVASAVIMLAKVGPFLWGMPLLVYVCFFVIILLSFSLVVSIIREGKGGDYNNGRP